MSQFLAQKAIKKIQILQKTIARKHYRIKNPPFSVK